MTSSRHISQPMRGRRARATSDRILSAGLAAATCVGIVGVIGARTLENSAAVQVDLASSSIPAEAQPATSSTGLTEAQLDTYAAQLAEEGAKLDAYRTKLRHLAKSLRNTQAPASATSSAPATAAKPTPVAKPAPKPIAKPKPVAKPAPAKQQSTTKSS